ncbi:hypothetical protein P3T76_005891 [Phytophthora citrophthora]|uniref:Uncharacterized protein n=1 Tax=Phytophthora citrophthora TaxID=4793 RepID=A0AAD9GPK3_9STRA|nr:hypothetical protein P3T76_005891 [Phytophthora citrophthora]
MVKILDSDTLKSKTTLKPSVPNAISRNQVTRNLHIPVIIRDKAESNLTQNEGTVSLDATISLDNDGDHNVISSWSIGSSGTPYLFR